jgi:chromosome transmission fidelity protein 1
VVALGGRKAMCGNREVLAKYKNNESALNDACLDMKKSKATNCPLLSNTAAVETLALHTLAQPTDIEEAAFLGSTMQTCAYYASRSALAAAEVIVMPYSMLLSPQTRESIGLSLEQAFVIVDEAHNLPEALRALHTSRLSLPVVKSAMEQLTLYIAKYVDRLAGRNLHYLGQLKRILKQIEKYLLRPADKLKQTSMMTADELLIELRLVNVNLFKILRYLQQTRLAQKLLGFTQYRMSQQQSSQNITDGATKELIRDDGLSKHVSAMSVVQIFLEKLACSSYEGKITIEVPDENDSRVKHPGLRYVLLNPAVFFDNVLKEACALALVGGTLRPFVHMAAELLGVEQGADVLCDAATADEQMARTAGRVSSSFVSPTITAFTCDHVVSPSNVLLQCVSTGPTGQTLDFRHQQRSTIAVCDELGRTLVEICRTVPNGFVVFLPSYSYEEFLVSHWKKTGAWKTLQSIKRIHREPKTTQNIEASLEAYAADASTENGALLFSVIGGKLSEGINFSNEMARCVAVTGLPYPDITDTELKEKMASMDRASTKSITGQAFYHNLCMRAINQSVGRAIRHANDFAAIILLDRRYQTDNRVWDGIPNWLKKSVVDGDWRKDIPLSQRLDNMKTFFQTHKS